MPPVKPKNVLLAVFVLLFLFGVAGLARAPFSLATQISNCTTINQSGNYVLTQNLVLEVGENECIRINSNYVSLDCNGHSLSGLGGSTSIGVFVSQKNFVEIKNCLITRFGDGVRAYRSTDIALDNNTFFRNYHGILFYGTTQSDLTGNAVLNSSACNTLLTEGSSRNRVEGNVMAYSRWGCSLTIANASNQNNVSSNGFYSNYRSGIRVEYSSQNFLARNAACWNGPDFMDLNCTSAQIDGGGNVCGTQARCRVSCAECSSIPTPTVKIPSG